METIVIHPDGTVEGSNQFNPDRGDRDNIGRSTILRVRRRSRDEFRGPRSGDTTTVEREERSEVRSRNPQEGSLCQSRGRSRSRSRSRSGSRGLDRSGQQPSGNTEEANTVQENVNQGIQQERSLEKAGRGRIRDRSRSRGHSRGRSRGHSRGRSRGNSRGRSRGNSRGRSRGNSRERSRDQSRDKTIAAEKSTQNVEIPQGNSQEVTIQGENVNNLNRVASRTQTDLERNRGRKRDRSRSRGHSRGRSRGHSRGKSRGHSRGRSRGHSRGRSRGHSRGKSRGHSRGRSRDHSRDNTTMIERSGKGIKENPQGNLHDTSIQRKNANILPDTLNEARRGRKRDRSRSRGHSRGRSRGHSRGRSRGHSRGRSRGHSRGRSRGHSRGRSHGHSRDESRGHSRENSRANTRDRSAVIQGTGLIITLETDRKVIHMGPEKSHVKDVVISIEHGKRSRTN